jgi:hypothetical protein
VLQYPTPNPSSRMVTLGSTKSLTEMSTRAAGAWRWQPHQNLRVDCLENVGASTSQNPARPPRLSFLIPYTFRRFLGHNAVQCSISLQELLHLSSGHSQIFNILHSITGIVHGLEDRVVGVRVQVGSNIFSSPGSGAHPAYQMGTGGAHSPGVKRPGRQSDHSPPTSAKFKKTWIYTSTPPYAFMA